MFQNDFSDLRSLNCQACGAEHHRDALKTVQLAGFRSPILVCDTCTSKDAAHSFKDAADILNDIVKIAHRSEDPENRLKKIMRLLGG